MNRTVTVKGTDLTRVLVNMDLWLLSGYLHVDEDGIRGYATDGFVAMADACDLQGKSENWLPGDDYLYKVDEEDVDHLLLITRKIGAKNIELICADSGLVVDGYGFENTEPDQDKKPKWVLDVNPEEESSFGSEEKEAPEWVHLLLDSLTYQ